MKQAIFKTFTLKKRDDIGPANFKNSLSKKIILGVLVACAGLGIAMLYAQYRTLVEYMREAEIVRNSTDAKAIHGLIRARLNFAEALATAEANVYNQLDKDESLFKKVYPAIINKQGLENFIAGGGIWPEPFKFDGKTERRSFFWGRNKDGVLEYIDDYNKPEGKGYHNEEWYVPARFWPEDECYWSKSYVDPYSFQSMVTCTIPIKKDGEFLGVSTIDLKLEGIGNFLNSVLGQSNRYGFIVDRDNKFIFHPDEKGIKKVVKDGDNELIEKINAQEYTSLYPEFAPIAEFLEQINKNMRDNFFTLNKTYKCPEIAKYLTENSYQINLLEAQTIEGLLCEEISIQKSITGNYAHEHQRLEISNDSILNEAVFVDIFEMEKTGWKLGIVTSKAMVFEKIYENMMALVVYNAIILLIIFVVFVVYLKRGLLKPIKNIIASIKDNFSKFVPLDENIDNELGEVAYWYNRRTKETIDAKTHAEKMSKAKSEFLSNMSHELRTPMHAILNFANMANKFLEKNEKEKVVKYLDNIHVSGKRLLGLLNDLLDLSKLESGKAEFSFASKDINQLIDQSLNEVESLLVAKKLTVKFINSEGLKSLMIDGGKVSQVLINVLSNAIKFSPQEGEIEIKTEEVERDGALGVNISVKDEGIGIPEGEEEAIFDQFVQSSKTKTGAGGTGLGLSICRNIVEGHRGKIWAEIRKDRSGSIFNIYLPYNREDKDAKHAD